MPCVQFYAWCTCVLQLGHTTGLKSDTWYTGCARLVAAYGQQGLAERGAGGGIV
jgi:hypothetical protein